MTTDAHWMALALEQAQLAAQSGEVPVGAVIVRNGQLVAVGHNSSVGQHDPSAHAEVVVLRRAAQVLQNYRLDECEIYVTLEPCAMCAGAILHSRLARLVYGAADPKTGAAGSVLNVFNVRAINHQTRVTPGVLADQCGELLQVFFKTRRNQSRQEHVPLREDALRTPDTRFEAILDFPFSPQYVSNLAAVNGLRMHYVDEGPSCADQAFVCLHASSSWSYAFRLLINDWSAQGARVLAPDLMGFGKSDKPKRSNFHHLEIHLDYLSQWLDALNLRDFVLVVEGDAKPLGLQLARRNTSRCLGVLCTGLQDSHVGNAAYAAPFPDSGHYVGPKAVAALLNDIQANTEGIQVSSALFVLEQDPVATVNVLRHLRAG